MSEHDSDFFRTLTLVMVGLGVFFIIIIVAANWISSGTSDSANDPRIKAQTEEVIKPVGQVETEVKSAPVAAAAPAAGGGAINGQAAYQQACFACHGTGAAGAPKLGDKAAWVPRISQGKSTLYQHAINGKGAMPPRGGSQLDDDTIKAIVDYMVSQAK